MYNVTGSNIFNFEHHKYPLMANFFRMFFASLLALLIFSLIGFFLFIALISGLAKSDRPKVADNSVLVLNLDQLYMDRPIESALTQIQNLGESDVPGLYDVVRLIRKAKNDKKIKGIYILTGMNMNGFATNEEIRNALIDFKESKKFMYAYGELLDQKSYHVANTADRVYLNPMGLIDWRGFSANLLFLKGTLDKLQIEPQIFYAGKFKSATEPLRVEKMTEENRLQTSVWLNDLYSHFLQKAAEMRNIDTTTLHRLANEGSIQTPEDAKKHKLIDGTLYDDQVRDEIKQKLSLGKYDRINFISINDYYKSGEYRDMTGDRIAVIYAEGIIIDGKGDQGMIGSTDYLKLIRRARLDKNIKAIVLRVNSGGGSALASETIWRELSLAKKEKPLVVSFGDVAASGGYYIGCVADSIFASPVTITGSIGVFGVIPNMQEFFKNKLGVTFDGVRTGPYADLGAIYRPMTDNEKKIVQNNIDGVYNTFKQRVAEGRKKPIDYIDTIAQGRVWSGYRALDNHLIDRFGGMHDAIECAARMAKITDYKLREFPEVQSIFKRLFGSSDKSIYSNGIRKEIGEENYKIYDQMRKVKELTGVIQARLPFEFFIE